ncbi:MAG: hypothetical protein A2Z98_08785 [Spirochaetes bacterium GWB1_27_13]|nr:MAG: hypothetical protein A2Z98_08785 [Spirochaetes bacterium GWB1_27_13]
MQDLFLFFNISIISLSSMMYVYFIIKILLIKRKEASHWIFLAICFLLLLRMTSFNLLIIPALKKSNILGILLYRVQSISVIFLPALLAHLFYSLLYKSNKRNLRIILFLYLLSLLFYISALIGFNPITKEIKIENDKMYFIINTSSYIYKSIIIFFIFSILFSIYLLNKLSKVKMINKDKKIINIIKWAYIFTFVYGYIIQLLISLINPKYFSLTPYLIIIFSIIIYYTIKRYNFLKIYKTNQFSNLINEDFTLPFIITDEKGVIIKSNFNNINNDIFYGKSIYYFFPDSMITINSILEEGKIVKNINFILANHQNQIEITYTVDINPIKDKFQDIIGLFILQSDYKISLNSFSKREQDIIHYLKKGLSYKEVAYELNISYNTVNTHIKNIYKKSDVNDRKELLDSLS